MLPRAWLKLVDFSWTQWDEQRQQALIAGRQRSQALAAATRLRIMCAKRAVHNSLTAAG